MPPASFPGAASPRGRWATEAVLVPFLDPSEMAGLEADFRMRDTHTHPALSWTYAPLRSKLSGI